METVLVAMSGGVDSSTTAFKLLQEGYNIIGLTLSMGRKCDENAINDARKVAEMLRIKHNVLDISTKFSNNVIDYFINSYFNGETPNPCALCNKTVKFKELIAFMKNIGANFIATGHYAKITNNNEKYELHKAEYLEKDQSYFLSTLEYNYLQYIKFPLHSMTKPEVRELAKKLGLHVAEKNDSQDACFIETNYKDFLEKNSNKIFKKGLIKHINGEILGEHDGIINYTIGQRKGLGISYKKPIFVIKIDTTTSTIYVGSNEDLFCDNLEIKNMNILTEIDQNKKYTIKLRSTHCGQDGYIKLKQNNTAKIKLCEKTRAITKGQLCCIYNGTQVVASGWIL